MGRRLAGRRRGLHWATPLLIFSQTSHKHHIRQTSRIGGRDGTEILVAMGMPLQRELAAQRAAAAAAAAARTTNPTAAAYGAKIVAMQRGANGRFKTISIGKRKRIHQLNQKKKKVLRRGDNGKFC